MARKKDKRKRSFDVGNANAPATPPRQARTPEGKPKIRWGLIALFLLISIGGTYLAIWMRPKKDADRYTYKVLEKYDHDSGAFTQGLVVHDGFLWESTGRYKESTMRKTELATGKVLDTYKLPDELFGEGMTWLNGKFYQLTWKKGKAFVYSYKEGEGFKVINEFKYDGEGWGLTTDGTDLIFSDGSREIKFLDPETFEEKRSIWVRQPSGAHVGQLNELEFFGGKIYANKYQSDWIYEIDPVTGDVTKIIDLQGLWVDRPADGVLNGIAVNPKSGKLLVTGKLCPTVFEVNLRQIRR